MAHATIPVLVTAYLFSRSCHPLHVFPRWPPRYMFPRACHSVARFPALVASFMFSRSFHSIARFPAVVASLTFSCACHPSHVCGFMLRRSSVQPNICSVAISSGICSRCSRVINREVFSKKPQRR